MYFFDKKVEYLIWNMGEGQARGVGTARFLAMDGVCRIEVTITGCGRVQGTYPVYVLSGDLKSLLGEITMTNGKGELFIKCDTVALGDRKIPYQKVTGIHVALKSEGYLEQRWLPIVEEIRKEAVNREDKVIVNGGEDWNNKAVRRKAEKWEDKEILQECKKGEETAQENETRQNAQEKQGLREKEEGASEQGQKMQERKEQPVKKPPEKEGFCLYPSKWKQLCTIYPIVHPFGDGRAYLSIEPRDFVVLQERFQPMVENSFLLHGFYHYRHLLLGRHQQGRNVRYYLGVPGVFYEKEKAAAVFYGFESFEGAEHPTKEGDFGYYMKQVQI